MNANYSHIISRFAWDTSFDRREQAVELQERLSRWSKVGMPGEISGVLDNICPDGLIWKIQSLEVDLGEIDYNNLEFELSEKLRRRLSEKLMDFLIRGHEQGSSIEMLDENTSQLDIISNFLLTGVIPWNYKGADGSINNLLGQQLQHNLQGVIEMLKAVWRTSESVRKRVAWQFTEPNIVKIVKGLEPGRNAQIINFSTEFNKIQVKESIVKTGNTDFRKNLWLWILNYLFTERGTIFNKVAFLKSSIRQMADHYNIGYLELFDLIEQAVDEVDKRSYANSDFITTLKMLARENKAYGKKTYSGGGGMVDFWQLLKKNLSDPALKRSRSQKIEFNELVINLSKQDTRRFNALMGSISYSEKLWLHVIRDLNETSLTVILKALTADGCADLIQSIRLLNALGKQTQLKTDRKTLWAAGVKYLHKNKNAAFNNKQFFNYYLAGLTKGSTRQKDEVLEQLITANPPGNVKIPGNLDVYTGLKEALMLAFNEAFVPDRFKQRLMAFYEELQKPAPDKTLCLSLAGSLAKYIRLNPAAAFKVLVKYPDKNHLHKILPFIIDEQATSLLLNNAGGNITIIVQAVQRVAANKEYRAGLGVAMEAFSQAILHMLVLNTLQKGNAFFEQIAGLIYDELPVAEKRKFGNFLRTLFNEKGMKAPVISDATANRLISKYERIAGLSVLEQVFQIIKTSSHQQKEAGRLLNDNFTDAGFVQLRRYQGAETSALLNYFLPGGDKLMAALVKKYQARLSNKLKQYSASDAVQRLSILFWRCVVNYADYNGSADRLKKCFDKAVMVQYPVLQSAAKRHRFKTESSFIGGSVLRLKSGPDLPASLLFTLIEQCLTEGKTEINYNGSRIRFSELMAIALDLNTHEMPAILTTLPVTQKRISMLIAVVDFNRFSLWINAEIPGIAGDTIEAVRQLHLIVTAFTHGGQAKEIDLECWNYLWTFIANKASRKSGFIKLIQYVFKQISQKTGMNAAAIVAKMQEMDLNLSPVLSSAIKEYFPGIALVQLEYLTKNAPEGLLKAKQLGVIDELISYLFNNGAVPAWYDPENKLRPEWLLNEIITHYPAIILAAIRQQLIPEKQWLWLGKAINFTQFTRSMASLNRAGQPALEQCEKLYRVLGAITINGISTDGIRQVIFNKVVKALTGNNWRLISAQNIWNELVWDLCTKHGIPQKQLLQSLANIKTALPAALQISLQRLLNQDQPVTVKTSPDMNEKSAIKFVQKTPKAPAATETVAVKNAGLVLLNNYIPMLLERLGLINDKKEFTNNTARHNATHYLQFVATGQSETEEIWLPLNKVLCGIPLAEAVPAGVEISEDDEHLIEGLINAAIGYWPEIGSCSVPGFRGNWLVRDGLLTEQEERWELTVEKRPYDLLISRSPFSFSIIKYPWMPKPLHVNWPC
ncbi:contractile injection system tape measure protein [Mucilaginibacter celer]|uniref:Uncharacterized protein n=1 Tax=Mucilaginibacter celer TaxID=2305508 RepID=A0A494VZW8_9SPHI|nr:contractile injection system tape measure protein [Mucilaginibacter celer]AYL99040.1 hypothetical protein HYN43_028870 [Mucilaginibacter celer]